ncbi:hypothetical protein GLOTRDRAFT_125143 [Gloeophyllum trabeum ATCC 11539]|uniref:Uncharacterized protein n=1 Tax=Gloeophyllum trabeum (strain ATCC 11539 / FP-39264 / Madison 617) TaxID=670483 RepID=S7QG13_GLOTA|nr:uncharacterized protein GLOTRDRAFT_125143 [Gloeophyllum trabeum ATCC 11539]EPQ58816.1 hypothetical protein GLOTRDRAFT_125143 [Gloeophyllum trabeum ATCC 11539]
MRRMIVAANHKHRVNINPQKAISRQCLAKGHAPASQNHAPQSVQSVHIAVGLSARNAANDHHLDAASPAPQYRPRSFGSGGGNRGGVGFVEQVGEATACANGGSKYMPDDEGKRTFSLALRASLPSGRTDPHTAGRTQKQKDAHLGLDTGGPAEYEQAKLAGSRFGETRAQKGSVTVGAEKQKRTPGTDRNAESALGDFSNVGVVAGQKEK